MSIQSSNPALKEDTFRQFGRPGTGAVAKPMTIEGTVNKTGILLLLAVISASFTWTQVLAPGGAAFIGPLLIGSLIGSLIVSLVTIFKPSASPYTAPVYAVLEGLLLGAISAVFNVRYPGIAAQAIGLTFGTLGVMLVAYRSGLIRATEKFKLGVIAATGAIALYYIVAMVAGMFGATALLGPLYSSSPLGIGVSLVIVVVAALNLILDFDFIEQGANYRAPAYMEWYGAFSLMVTLVWLYLEMLRLLAKLNDRR
jgi:uncharacterized YccA/Bax inhibitor family protein